MTEVPAVPTCGSCGVELTDRCVPSLERRNRSIYCCVPCRNREEPPEVPTMVIPSRWPVKIAVYKDVGKRRSRCFVCDLPVSKGEPRLRVESDGPWADNGRGGQWKIRRSFCHAACWIRPFADHADTTTVRRCRLCEEPLTTFGGFFFADNQSYSICESCRDSPAVVLCKICHLYHLRRLASPLVGDDKDGTRWACHGCIDLFDAPSLRTQRRQLREDRALHLAIEKIKAGWD